MGFWSDTGKFLSATGGALSEGMELLAQGASELEKAARGLNLESHIKLLESRRVRMDDNWFDSFNLDQHQVLLNTYAERIKDFPPDSTVGARAGLAKLNSDRRDLVVNRQVENISEFKKRVESANYQLPIDAINARKQLLEMLEDLLRTAREDEHGQILERAKVSIVEYKSEIAGLELERRSTEITKYSSSVNRTKIERFDGKLSGVYEDWYETGKPRWVIPFLSGQVVGTVEHWREDGSRLLEARFANTMQSFQGYAQDSQLLLKGQISKPDIRIFLCFAELVGISFRHRLGVRPSKIKFACKVLLTPKLLSFLWKARKPGSKKDMLRELMTLSKQLNQALEKLWVIRTTG